MIDLRYTITIKGAYDALERVKQGKGLRDGLYKAGYYLKQFEAEYPPERHGSLPGGFVSDRQRRGFFARLRSGEIQVPYQRTFRLMQSWGVKADNGGLTVHTGTFLDYARWTHSEAQALYHRITGWKQVGTIAEREGGAVYQIVSEGVKADIG